MIVLSNYCVLPFNSVSLGSNGEIRVCCNAGYIPTGLNIDSLNVDEIINNDYIYGIRETFIENKKHNFCNRCWQMESAGTRSFRDVANKNKFYGYTVSNLNLKKVIDFSDIRYLDIGLGNKCNLACRMCNWSSSSLLAKQLAEIEGREIPNDIELSRDNKDKVLELIYRAKNLACIYMLGGEPLINDFHDEILDVIIKNNRANQIAINYSTNLQVNKIEDFIERWNNFAEINLQVSIDGEEEVYEYIRWPGKWDKVYKNLNIIQQKIKNEKVQISIATTIQNINALSIPKLLKKCCVMHNKVVPFFFIPVVGTPILNNCPNIIIEKGLQKLAELPVYRHIPINDLISQYKQALTIKKDKDKIIDFFKEQKKFDSKRNQNLFQTVPYFNDLAEEYKIEKW